MPDIIPATAIPALLASNTPLLDVRAPVEFLHGAFPGAKNLPLLNDHERAAVGKLFKSSGQQAAIDYGHKLVNGHLKEARVKAWERFITTHAGTAVYCYRGGLRSKIVQQWLAETGIRVPRIEGGYKLMRRILIDTIDAAAASTPLLIIAGKTGSGKTHVINDLNNSVDLEGLANHRGSAFGPRVHPQPTQINFENALAIALLRIPYQAAMHLFLEDESRAIGSLSVPESLHNKMLQAPVAVLEESLAQRVNTILQDYIVSNFREFIAANPRNGQQLFSAYLLGSLAKIRRRLGGELHDKLRLVMEAALAMGEDGLPAHAEWIEQLLINYYDPMYEYQLGKKDRRVIFRGDRNELLSWAAHLDQPDQKRRA